MAFVFTIAGLLMVVTGVKNTYAQFGTMVSNDFTGPGNFTYWLASLGAVGAIGYVDELREFSRYFMALIVIAMVLANKGLFANLQSFLTNGPKAPSAAPASTGSGLNINVTLSSVGNALFGSSPPAGFNPNGTVNPSAMIGVITGN